MVGIPSDSLLKEKKKLTGIRTALQNPTALGSTACSDDVDDDDDTDPENDSGN